MVFDASLLNTHIVTDCCFLRENYFYEDFIYFELFTRIIQIQYSIFEYFIVPN